MHILTDEIVQNSTPYGKHQAIKKIGHLKKDYFHKFHSKFTCIFIYTCTRSSEMLSDNKLALLLLQSQPKSSRLTRTQVAIRHMEHDIILKKFFT